MHADRDSIDLELLVLRCRRGDRRAFEELVRDWEPRLFPYVRRFVGDEEEAYQVLQDVWLRVLRGIRRLGSPDRLPAWLYAVAHHAAMSHHREGYARERAARRAEPRPASEGDGAGPLDDAEQVHRALALLSSVDREVLTLFFLRELSIGEVAGALGIPPGTVKSRLFKARKALRNVIEKEK